MRSGRTMCPDRSGGEGGIRTHGELAPTAVFKTAALNHSATSPLAPPLSRSAAARHKILPGCRFEGLHARARLWHKTGMLALRAMIGKVAALAVAVVLATPAAAPAIAQDETGFQAYLRRWAAGGARKASRRVRSTGHPDPHFQCPRHRARPAAARDAAERADPPSSPIGAACRCGADRRRGAAPISASVRASRGSSARPACPNRSWSRSGGTRPITAR
jgi:hypothetical protein